MSDQRMREAAEKLLESHAELLDAMTDHGDVALTGEFESDFAAAAFARKELDEAMSRGTALVAENARLTEELKFANAERERLTRELRQHYAMRCKAEEANTPLIDRLLVVEPIVADIANGADAIAKIAKAGQDDPKARDYLFAWALTFAKRATEAMKLPAAPGAASDNPSFRQPTPGLYPPGWPLCACGDWCMDGKATCGRVECL